jgi:hypothetical protein
MSIPCLFSKFLVAFFVLVFGMLYGNKLLHVHFLIRSFMTLACSSQFHDKGIQKSEFHKLKLQKVKPNTILCSQVQKSLANL